MKVAVMGYGTVGSGVCEVIETHQDTLAKRTGGKALELARILDLREFPDLPYADKFTKEFDDILHDPDIRIVVETMGGLHPAYDFVKSCLLAGKNVVTSNKELVAAKGDELLEIAKNNNLNFLFEASVGGGIPILRPIDQCLAANEVYEIAGILNGTCNYMLDHMERSGLSFEEALARAQALGYAEADPTADITGADVRNKAIISASLAYRTPVVSDIPTAGIVGVTSGIIAAARERGRSLRLMMLSERRGDRYAVGIVPVLLSQDEIAAHVHDNLNYGRITGDVVGALSIVGQGAGGRPTADAMIQDLISLGRGETGRPVLDRPLTYDPALLCGTGHFPDEVLPGRPLAELIEIARQKQSFLAFEPQATE